MIERQRFEGDAGELHAIEMPKAQESDALWVMRPTGAAVAMGSSQTSDQFDHDRLRAAGVKLVERRSGGGAVFIEPTSTVWIDTVVPRASDLWSSELTETFLRTGRIWQKALASCGIETQLCTESAQRTTASSLACWAGVSWGELTIGDAKVVGLSQRRTRWGARVQAMAVLDGSSARIAEFLTANNRPTVQDAIAVTELAVTRAALESAVLEAFNTQ